MKEKTSLMCDNEEWNKVHAQLLKSVADAQARLLAGINEIADRLPTKLFAELASTDQALNRIYERLNEIADRTTALEHVGRALDVLSGKMEQIRALLAPPRRRLRTKRIVKRARSTTKRSGR